MGLSILSLALLGAVGAAGYAGYRFLRASKFFAIEDVEIAGASPEIKTEIGEMMARLRKSGDANLLLLRPSVIRARLESMPRVRSASIEKRFPRTLKIRVEERKPLMIANGEDLYWIDREGVLLARATAQEASRSKAPILTGLRSEKFAAGAKLDQPMLAEALATVELLEAHDPNLYRQFAEWHLNGENELEGILKQGTQVRFGSGDPVPLLAKLSAVLRERPELAGRKYLDLRFNSQVVYSKLEPWPALGAAEAESAAAGPN